MNFSHTFFLLFLHFVFTNGNRPDEDKVSSLPGLNFKLNFEQYSGYLDAGKNIFYHYWFLESQLSPPNDPLILFLNGGPGCSSLAALFTECGPFRIKDSGKTIFENPYSWNKIANIIFLESPSGTGFSYSTNKIDTLSDVESVVGHYRALESFYKKFPEFKTRPLFLIGQSYAAIYVTTLAKYIHEHQDEFQGKLEGVAIGNGLTSYRFLINGRFYYNYYRGLMDENQWRNVISQCCKSQPEWKCDLYNWYLENGTLCHNLVQDALDVSIQGRDPFNIDFECYRPAEGYSDDEECGVPFGTITKHYLDREDVRRAANIDVNRFRNYSFEACSDSVGNAYENQYDDLTEIMTQTLGSGKIRFLIMNGESDSKVNPIGTQWFVDNLERRALTNRTPIFYIGLSQPNVGYQQNYDGLDFVTVRGGGHYVPADKPRETLQIVANFLRGIKNYSTPDGLDTKMAPSAQSAGFRKKISYFMTLAFLVLFIFMM